MCTLKRSVQIQCHSSSYILSNNTRAVMHHFRLCKTLWDATYRWANDDFTTQVCIGLLAIVVRKSQQFEILIQVQDDAHSTRKTVWMSRNLLTMPTVCRLFSVNRHVNESDYSSKSKFRKWQEATFFYKVFSRLLPDSIDLKKIYSRLNWTWPDK